MKQELWDDYAPGGTTCVLCGKVVRRPVNRNQHAERHVRHGEAHRVRHHAPHWETHYYVGKEER